MTNDHTFCAHVRLRRAIIYRNGAQYVIIIIIMHNVYISEIIISILSKF